MSETNDDPSIRKPTENPYDDPELIAVAGVDAEYLYRMVAVKIATQRLADARAELVRYRIEHHYLPAPPDEEI